MELATWIGQLQTRLNRRSNMLYRLPVIGGLFLLSVFLAVRVSRKRLPLDDLVRDPLVLMIPALAGVMLLLFRPQLGLLALIAGSLVVPFKIGTGTGTSINSAVLLVGVLSGLWLFRMIAHDRQITIVRSRPILPVIVLVISAFVSFAIGQLPWSFFAQQASIPAQLGGLGMYLFSALAFLLAANTIQEMKWLQRMCWLFMAIGAVYLLFQYIPPLRNIEVVQDAVTRGSMFWIWLAALPLSQAIYNDDLDIRWRLALVGLTAAAFGITLGRSLGWTSGWLPAAAAVMVIVVAGRTRLSLWLTLLMIPVVIFLGLEKINSLIFVGDNEYSLITRVEAWRIVLEIVKDNWVFGLGLSNYYWYTSLYPILGYFVNFNSHNNYIDLIAQTGVVGLLAFLWFAFEIGRLTWNLLDRVPQGFMRAYMIGALGGLAGMLVAGMFGDWVIPFVYNVGYEGFRASVLGWIFLGSVVALEQIVLRENPAPSSTQVVDAQMEGNYGDAGTAVPAGAEDGAS